MNLPTPAPLNVKSGSLSQNWKIFKRAWDYYEIACKLDKESNILRTATLLTIIGADAVEIYDGFKFDSEEDKKDINKVLEKLELFCIGEINESYERYVFNHRGQLPGEHFDTFLSSLRSLAKTCNFGALEDSLIRDRINDGVPDNDLRRRLLQERDLTLAKCIDRCRAHESTMIRLETMKSSMETVNATESNQTKKTQLKPVTESANESKLNIRECKFCGRKHIFGRNYCPAWGKVCNRCNIKNHFAVKCRLRIKYNHGTDGPNAECVDTYHKNDIVMCEKIYTNSSTNLSRKKFFTQLLLNNFRINFQIDCGATVNVISKSHYIKASNDYKLIKLVPTSAKLSMYNKTLILPLGKISLPVYNPKNGISYFLDFMVIKQPLVPLLGFGAIQELNLVTVNYENIFCTISKSCNFEKFSKMSLSQIFAEFADIFTGTGKLEGKLKLEVDNTVTPVQMPVRKVPLSLQSKVKNELDRLMNEGIISPVDCHTPWISNLIVVSKKSDNIRLCLDPKPLNKAFKRNNHPMPTIDDVLPHFHKAKVFTIADVKNGFWHIELDVKSSYLTTFGTPWGRYKWRLAKNGIRT
uniref:uncharacterized protein LOC120331303 n=1 Tax=Styela clava TaxID=7725 RepID=UPI00193A58B7|nr:uncharacterized protein LOC120331303 [Styela clava]